MTEENAVINLLEEILLWMKYDYLDAKRKLLEVLDTEKKIIAYELSNGERSVRDISKFAGVHFTTIGDWWNKWFEDDLMVQTEKYGGSRYKRLCSLTKIGIKIPEIKEEK